MADISEVANAILNALNAGIISSSMFDEMNEALFSDIAPVEVQTALNNAVAAHQASLISSPTHFDPSSPRLATYDQAPPSLRHSTAKKTCLPLKIRNQIDFARCKVIPDIQSTVTRAIGHNHPELDQMTSNIMIGCYINPRTFVQEFGREMYTADEIAQLPYDQAPGIISIPPIPASTTFTENDSQQTIMHRFVDVESFIPKRIINGPTFATTGQRVAASVDFLRRFRKQKPSYRAKVYEELEKLDFPTKNASKNDGDTAKTKRDHLASERPLDPCVPYPHLLTFEPAVSRFLKPDVDGFRLDVPF